ncbi:MAG: S-methyl-5-thioribose-1-phosphate isomerase, partial [Proteobacteria bacterium]
MRSFDTLRWEDGGLALLDQRLLPREIKYVRCESAADTADAIQRMVVRGAPAIGCAAAYGVALEARRHALGPPDTFHPAIAAGIERLARSRPTAVNLAWALKRMQSTLDALGQQSPVELAAALLTEAHVIREEDAAMNRRLGAFGAELVPDGSRILTHCNAGALATAGHGTALGVIRSAIETGKRVRVYTDETRPWLQGARLTAWELMQDAIPTTVLADVAAGLMLSRGEVDLIIVGADRVAANGDTANKIGTYPLAVLAQRHAIPFYVACPLSTIDLSIRDGSEIPIEERAADEVTGFGGVRWAPEGVAVRNPAFDVTPAALITALITERGVVHRPDHSKLTTL